MNDDVDLLSSARCNSESQKVADPIGTDHNPQVIVLVGPERMAVRVQNIVAVTVDGTDDLGLCLVNDR
ncbi:MAG: hypothetical protein WA988_12740 [Candidatus Nanopelagicales bacterium]